MKESKSFVEIVTELAADIWAYFTTIDDNHQTALSELADFCFLNQTPPDECKPISLLGDDNQITAA